MRGLWRRERRTRAFTLTEVLVASVVTTVIAGATLATCIAASRMTHAQNTPAVSEATQYAQETLESLRNRVAADVTFFQDADGKAWQADPLPGGGESGSILAAGATRTYQVNAADCDGDGVRGDCYAVTVRVCWNDASC